MLSREAVVTTKGDPEHTGAVHGSQCRVSPQRTNSLCPCRNSDVGLQEQGRALPLAPRPLGSGHGSLQGAGSPPAPAPSLPPTSPLQPGRVLFLHSQVPHVTGHSETGAGQRNLRPKARGVLEVARVARNSNEHSSGPKGY